MIINVAGRGTQVQDSFREVLEQKLSKFDRFFQEDTRADVTITNEGGRETVEVTIHSEGLVFRSEATTYERLDSLDIVVNTLFRQIVKNRSKLQDRFRKKAYDPEFIEEFDPNLLKEQEDEGEYKIVRTKQFTMKPMFPEEAILQMNMLGHGFFMFHNADSDEIAVVYKRNDGNYGLIESD